MSGVAEDIRAPLGPPRPEGGARPDPAARRRWYGAVAVAVAAHLAGFFLFRVPVAPHGDGRDFEPTLFWTGSDQPGGDWMIEQFELFNPAPLFLPTIWNYATHEGGVGGERSPAEIFPMYEPRLTVAADRRPGALELVPASDDVAATVIQRVPWPYLAATGRRDAPALALSRRLARIEIRSIGDGSLVLTHAVPAGSRPAGAAWPDWAPLEMWIVVDSGALVGSPLLVRTTGSDEVDAFFRDYVAGSLRPGLLLPTGYFRVVIGP